MTYDTNRLARVGAAGLAAAGLAGVLWGSQQPERPAKPAEVTAEASPEAPPWAPPPGEARPACAFARGDVLTYRVTSRADMTLDPSVMLPGDPKQRGDQRRPKQRYTSEVAATLSVYAWGTSPHGETILAVSVQDYAGEFNGAEIPRSELEGLERLSLARVDRRCAIVAMARHESVEPEVQRVVQGLLDSANYTLPGDLTAPATYAATLQDDLGAYSADFHYSPSGRGHGELSSHKKLYPRQEGSITVEYRIVRSNMTVELGETAWFDRSEREDVIFGDVRNRPLSQIKQTSNITRVGARPEAFEGIDLALGEYVWGRVDPEVSEEVTEDTGLAGMPLEMGVAEYKRLLSSGEMSDWKRAREFLRQYLRANPYQAQALIDLMIQEGEFSEWERAVVMHVLSETGIPETRDALLAAAQSAQLDEKTRLQAAVAAGDLVNPNADTISRLAALGRRADGASVSANDMVGNASNYAVGTLLNEYEHASPEVAAAARAHIQELLEHEDPRRLREGLGAIANAADESFLPTVERLIEDPDPTTRRAAVRAIAKMNSEETKGLEDKIRARLHREDDEMVSQDYAQAKSQQIVEASDGVEVTDAEIWVWVAEFHAARQEVTRLQYVELLGHASRLNGEATIALGGIYWVARSARVRQAIGRYLTGEQIAAARY